jgi:hypothetical protein
MYQPYNILYGIANGYTLHGLKSKGSYVAHRLFSKDRLYTSNKTTSTVDQ